MARFYRIIKDHPVWEVGAILSNEEDDSSYCPIDDLYNKQLDNGSDAAGFSESRSLVENQKEWFERVYKVNVLKQVKYLSKEDARAANDELYKEKK